MIVFDWSNISHVPTEFFYFGPGSFRHSMEKLSFRFAGFDSSHGCLLNSGSMPKDESRLEGQRNGEVLATCLISICNLFARKLVSAELTE